MRRKPERLRLLVNRICEHANRSVATGVIDRATCDLGPDTLYFAACKSTSILQYKLNNIRWHMISRENCPTSGWHSWSSAVWRYARDFTDLRLLDITHVHAYTSRDDCFRRRSCGSSGFQKVCNTLIILNMHLFLVRARTLMDRYRYQYYSSAVEEFDFRRDRKRMYRMLLP